MNELGEKGYVAIKGRMYSTEKKYYSIFLIVVNKNEHSIDAISGVISLSKQVYEILPSQSVSDFDSRINKIKFDGQYVLSSTKNLEELLINISKDQSLYKELERYTIEKSISRVELILKSFFSKVLDDNSISIELGMENITGNEVNMNTQAFEELPLSSLDEIDSPEPNMDAGTKQDSDGNVILNLDLVLAPAGGRLVNDLRIRDKIMVRILPNSRKANYFIDLYKLRKKDKQILPIPAEVKSIKEYEKKIELMVKIDDNIFGRVIEKERVLVRLFDPQKFEALPRKSQPTVDISQFAPASNKINKGEPGIDEKKSSKIMIIAGIVSLILLFLVFTVLLT